MSTLTPVPASTPLERARRPARSRVGWAVVALLALAIAAVSLGTYASQSLQSLGESNSVVLTYAEGSDLLQAALYTHIVSASAALLLGPVQFWKRLRHRFTTAHRISGRIYAVSVTLGALSGLVIAPSNSAGGIGVAGFGLLGLLWLGSVVLAVRAARQRHLAQHQAWMIRNYALTFAAVTLRLWLIVLIVAYTAAGAQSEDAAFASAYLWVPFLCWVPNVLVAEWLIRRRGLPSLIGRRTVTAR
ncbi:DUF2306 domain-containing protein [Demequina sp. B12]|uniref:DUF2306 domain-containing protein n=1 Tax=Demequina sp. B12 TaxID=2992757 RepID=UPI00237A228D|nr:DUF2306 domain-containing protein [Demequina sp. B12]MDE0573502.1 DUF2306 domain-containing protein [Demequina sp. B12]